MTAQAFADLVQARSAGRARWQAVCPAHRDRSPSLSIREGDDGRVLVHCFAGCQVQAVLAALNLTSRDLFVGEPPSRYALEQARNERESVERKSRAEVVKERRLIDVFRRAGIAIDTLAARLAFEPACDETAEVFHAACRLLHIAETGLHL